MSAIVLAEAAKIVLEAGVGWAVQKSADAGLKHTFRGRAAREELLEIAAVGIAAAVEVAPELATNLEDQAYAMNVLAPAVTETLRTRTGVFDADALASDFLARFVEPFLRSRPLDDVLRSVYGLEPERLVQAFAAMAIALRSGYLRSEHWSDPVQGAALDELLMRMADVQERLPPRPDPVALSSAQRDARLGSEVLRSWPQTIGRLHIDRPELEALRRRVIENPSQITLLIGVAGSGKSALLAGLTERLEADGLTVFPIKADHLPPEVESFADLSVALGLARPIDQELDDLARNGALVLVIDQLDAVSEVMDHTGRRMQVLLRLARRFGEARGDGTAHVVVSSRPFEARFDGRFESLDAKEFELGLPPYAKVEEFLREIGIEPDTAPLGLREHLRRPFLLKLFVQILQRGAPPGGLVAGELLNAWLATAPLGDAAQRASVFACLKQLAREMAEAESLWRPADRFDAEYPDAVRRAEACELVVRDGLRLAFTHQAWLDDFEARSLATSQALLDQAWSLQDGLFSRATVLRSLERFRAADEVAYGQALDGLLGDARTRRHLRHLAADQVASQTAPLPREVAWVRRLIREDAVIARRVIASLLPNWHGWRESLLPLLSIVRSEPGLAGSAKVMVVAEASVDRQSAEALVQQYWANDADDIPAFDIISRATLWSAEIRTRLAGIFRRQDIGSYAVAAYLTDLVDSDRADAAVDVLGAYLESATYTRFTNIAFHDLEKVAEAAPEAFARTVLPWFVEIAGAPQEVGSLRDSYLHSDNLPVGWDDAHESGTIFEGLRAALEKTAARSPEEYLELVSSYETTEIEEVQALIADGYAAGGKALAEDGLQWMLRDRRRFDLGTAHLDDEDRVGHMVTDWSTRRLLEVAAPYASAPLLQRLHAAIEAWDGYSDSAWEGDDVELRRQRRQWAESRRAGLLALLPPDVLTARRRRQMTEVLAQEPKLNRQRGRVMPSIVESPMSPGQMAKASDDDLMGMLDAVRDGTERIVRRGRRRMSGGFVEVARAFAAAGAEAPERAIALVRSRFLVGHHEYAAGELIRVLAEKETATDEDIRALILTLVERGFNASSFRRDVAWALQNIASRKGGLPDADLELLEEWVERDQSIVADRIARQELRTFQDRERNMRSEKAQPGAVLFGRGGRSLSILPGGNYTFFSAIAVGRLGRDPPDGEGWLEVLERHVDLREEPDVWRALLPRFGQSLYGLDRARVRRFFDRLWISTPDAFGVATGGYLWAYRELLSEALRELIMDAWVTSDDPRVRQLAGEYGLALALVDGVQAALPSTDEEAMGQAFAAAAAWRSEDPDLRQAAQAKLLPIAVSAKGDIAKAVASAISRWEPPPADQATRALLEATVANPDLLLACLGGGFGDVLKELLLEPGFEPLLLDLCEASLPLMLGSDRGHGGMFSAELVAVCVGLQHGPAAQRSRAMDLYERLLDAGVYGAEEAAKAALQR